jgi:hypothetical protein
MERQRSTETVSQKAKGIVHGYPDLISKVTSSGVQLSSSETTREELGDSVSQWQEWEL